MTQQQQQEYDMMRVKILNGSITEAQWKTYCMSMLEQLLEDNQDILISLKEWA